MANDRTLKLGLDASGYKVGADEVRSAVDTIRAYNRQLVDGLREAEKTLGGVGKAASNFGSTAQAAISSIGGRLRSAQADVTSFATEFISSMLESATSAEGLATHLGLSESALVGLGVAGAGLAAVTAGLGYAAKQSLDLEKSLIQVAARVDPSQFQRYKEAALALSQAAATSQQNAAAALTATVDLGYGSFEQQYTAALRALEVAKLNGTTAQAVLQSTQQILDAFSLSTEHAGEVIDKIITGANRAHRGFDDFGRAVFVAGGTLGSLGVSLDQTADIISKIAPLFVSAGQAGSTLASVVLALSQPLSPLQQKLQAIGVQIDSNTISQKGLSETFKELSAAVGDDNNQLIQLFGSVKTGKLVLAALSGDTKAAADGTRDMAGAVGALNEQLDRTKNLDTEKFERVTQSFKSGVVVIGDATLKFGKDLIVGADAIRDLNYRLLTAGYDVLTGRIDDARDALAKFNNEAKLTEEQAKKFDVKTIGAISPEFFQPVAATIGDTGVPAGLEFPAQKEPGRTLPRSALPLGPDEKEIVAMQRSIADLSASLDAKLGNSIDQEIAKFRESETAIKRQIEEFKKAGFQTDDLTAKLFALTQQNDSLISKVAYGGNAIGPGLTEPFEDLTQKAKELSSTLDQQVGTAFEQQASAARLSEKALRDQVEAMERAGQPVDELKAKLFALTLQNDLLAQSFKKDFIEQGVGRLVKDQDFQNSLYGKTPFEQQKAGVNREFDLESERARLTGVEGLVPQVEEARAKMLELLDAGEIKRKAEALGHAIADPITQGLEDIVFESGKASDILKRTFSGILRNIFQQQVSGPFNQFLSGLFTQGSERGNVFNSGQIVPFAQGGIPDVGNQPALFPMRGGFGSLREQGKTEAIVPVLARGPSGRLGVELVGGPPRGASPSPVQQNDQRRYFNVNVTLKDPGDARSRRQMINDLERLSRSS